MAIIENYYLIPFQPKRKRHISPIIGAVTYLGAVAHDIVGHIENPFMDTFRDRNGNINIHGDRDNNANVDCNGNCNIQGNVHGKAQGSLHGKIDVQGQGNVNAMSNVNANGNAKLNGNAGLNLNLNFGFRRTNAKQSSQTIFVPIDELTGIENLSSFGYPTRYAVYCIRKNIYE